MRPNRREIFRTDAAEKLDRLELVAALLERDATNNRMLLADLGYIRPMPGARPKPPRPSKLLKQAASVRAGARSVIGACVAIARSRRTHAVIAAMYAFVIDFAVVLATTAAAVIILAAVVLLAAPL